MNKAAFKDLLKRYLSNNCSEQEKLLVEGWYDWLGDEKDLVIDNIEALENKIWNQVKEKTIQSEQIADNKNSRNPFVLRRWYQHNNLKIAASILFIVTLGFYWFSSTKDFPTNLQQQTMVYENILYNNTKDTKVYWLEDSSKVTMYPNSQLEIPVAFSKHSNRTVHLKGVAIFDVTKNPLKPFLVHTGEVVTRVLGTSFKIVHAGKKENIEVEVLSGKVSVYNKNIESNQQKINNGVVLTPNQKVIYHAENKHFVTAVVANPILLSNKKTEIKKTTFVYNETPIKLVLQELEKNYGIQIVVDNERFKDCPFTANLADQSLFNKLEFICTSLNATFDVQGTTILINGRGCN